MIELAERLRRAVRQSGDENDLPDFLAERILAIADRAARGKYEREGIEKLIEQVRLYDTYGQTGYLGMGVNNLVLEKTIEKIQSQTGSDNG